MRNLTFEIVLQSKHCFYALVTPNSRDQRQSKKRTTITTTTTTTKNRQKRRPYKKPSKDIACRWILETLSRAGRNTSRYKQYSTIHASLSQGLNVESILCKRGWKSQNVFRKYYQLPIMTPDTPVMVATPSERNDISENFHN